MTKTKEELNTLKQEYETLNSKLKELSEDEIKQITGGDFFEVMQNISNGVEEVAGQILKASSVVSPEEILGGKTNVIPNNGNNN